ncbi:pilus assembly protein PilW [Ramlibacter sp. G-1-2-2]|uniref:Pilus assembly protein PilW n=1 Tax=Ramlibacter agri TaxID=2728837 RepID=A0A848GX87_9BURK|nr:PilW family protein [Ramlibacter agri]NML42974.1 pilus assembly protein PilW [Ramlibacter agri]
MRSVLPSADARRRQAGFTVIELMIGVVIGLLASLAVTQVLVNWEGQKRTVASGSDAQVNGALALGSLQRAVMPAGYGFAATPSVIGCTLTGTFSGNSVTATLPNFPTSLAPVVITDGASGAPDSIRILASGKTSYSIPLRVVAPGYTAGNASFPVSSVRGIAAGDIIVASNAGSACEIFQVSADPGSAPTVSRVDDGKWNAANKPSAGYSDGSVLLNMGVPIDATYSIANNALVAQTLKVDATTAVPSYGAATELYPNIVQLQALYGKDTNSDGMVDTWDNVTPTTNAGWLQVIAVRLAVVSRSQQYEKCDDTAGTGNCPTMNNISWDVGSALTATVAGSTACGTSQCMTIKLDTLTDWKHYRYKVFETIVPLRNLLWNS